MYAIPHSFTYAVAFATAPGCIHPGVLRLSTVVLSVFIGFTMSFCLPMAGSRFCHSALYLTRLTCQCRQHIIFDLYFLPLVPRADLVYLLSSWRVFSLFVFHVSDPLCSSSLAVFSLTPPPLRLGIVAGHGFAMPSHLGTTAGHGGPLWMGPSLSLCTCGMPPCFSTHIPCMLLCFVILYLSFLWHSLSTHFYKYARCCIISFFGVKPTLTCTLYI